MRYVTITLIIFCVLLASCSGSDPHLKKLTQDVYSQKTWEHPLPPYEFTSDGCSCWPDYEWIDCCVEHDAIYWMGGATEERKQADIALQKCVSQKGYPIIGKNPGKRVVEIAAASNIPSKTVERWIKKLREQGEIVFSGPRKSGGYFVSR